MKNAHETETTDAELNAILGISSTPFDLSNHDAGVLRRAKSILLEEARSKKALAKLEARIAKLQGELVDAKARAREGKNMADWARSLGA